MRSFGILRTNPGLTTNVKIMVESTYGLSLESINTNTPLSSSKYKKFEFNKDNYYDELLPYFFDGMPADQAFDIKYDDDSYTMTQEFSDQYDEIYQYGARNIIDNKNYTEEYEYFAPLYVFKNKLPKYFVIFRVDGPGIINLGKSNFRSEILSKLKTVSVFDLTKKTVLGEWLDNNINQNTFFPDTPLEMNYDPLEFSIWKGINYNSGGYIDRSFFMDHILENENEIFELEKFIFDGYRRNGVVFPNILNLSFLFDDTPADENRFKKWSINRYYGFYIEDMEIIKTISPYIPPKLNSGFEVLENNILYYKGGDPFFEGWSDDKLHYVEYAGNYYKVEKYTEKVTTSVTPVSNSTTGNTQNVQVSSGNLSDINDPSSGTYLSDKNTDKYEDRWRIISDISLSGKQDMINTNTGRINLNKELVDAEGINISIDDFERSDVWLIEIDGKYHNLVKNEEGNIVVNSDYSFYFSDRTYRYLINKNDPKYTKVISTIVDDNTPPKKFSIYRIKFTDIKDFDTRIVETESSKFEYELESVVTKTDEPKFYFTNLNSLTIPKRLDDFVYKNEYTHIPTSSEYTSNQETFKINGGALSQIWRKNSTYCRWGYEGSLSANDYPYTINNSLMMGEYNLTTNTADSSPARTQRNLDYFYTINSSDYSYTHQTLHIQKTVSDGVDPFFDFDFDKYFGTAVFVDENGASYSTDFDYFNHIFTMRNNFNYNKSTRNTKKYSEFISGDTNTPNYTLFRGMQFSIYDVSNIEISKEGRIQIINTEAQNRFDDYKFSILLTNRDNGMLWDIVERWDLGKSFTKGEIVVHDDILYVAVRDTSISDPSIGIQRSYKEGGVVKKTIESVKPTPYNLLHYNLTNTSPAPTSLSILSDDTKRDNAWAFYNGTTDRNIGYVFWNPAKATATGQNGYTTNEIVYRDGIFYRFNGQDKPVDFWNPAVALKVSGTSRFGYAKGNVVMYKGKFYKSNIDSNVMSPEYATWTDIQEDFTGKTRWSKVEIWQSNRQYGPGYSLVTHKGIIYRNTKIGELILSGVEPGLSKSWERLYSMDPDTNFIYTNSINPYTLQNDQIYRMISNPKSSTLENGIKIFINHRYKNVLVNIYINDNTLRNLRDVNRDEMYRGIYQKLTARNFIDSINVVSDKFSFSDYLKYVVISEDGTIKEYDYLNDLANLPHIIFAQGPEEIGVNMNSLNFIPVGDKKLVPTKKLNESKIGNLSELNYYNETNIAVDIRRNNDPTLSESLGLVKRSIYRFSGNYMPLFYDVQLFNTDNSIEYKTIELIFEISDPMQVKFLFESSGNIYQKSFPLSPGASFSQTSEYYSQIMNILRQEFPDVKFNYEIRNKNKSLLGGEVLILEDTYNEGLETWFDTSRSESYAKPIPSVSTPFRVRTELYPGNYSTFIGSQTQKSLMLTSQISLTTQERTYEFMVKSTEVMQYRPFMGDGTTTFGFDDGRLYMNTIFQNGLQYAVYSDNILQVNTWYHVVFKVVVNSTGQSVMDVYIDSAKRTSTDNLIVVYTQQNIVSSKLENIQSIFAIGAGVDYSNQNPPYTGFFEGSIASVRFYDRALKESEIFERYLSEHRTLSIKYGSSSADIKVRLMQNVPELEVDIYDSFDPLYLFYGVKLGATGGNPPYEYSFNGSSFSDTDFYTPIAKNSNLDIVVKDIVGLTSSIGYYTVNSVIEEKRFIDGTFIY